MGLEIEERSEEFLVSTGGLLGACWLLMGSQLVPMLWEPAFA